MLGGPFDKPKGKRTCESQAHLLTSEQPMSGHLNNRIMSRENKQMDVEGRRELNRLNESHSNGHVEVNVP